MKKFMQDNGTKSGSDDHTKRAENCDKNWPSLPVHYSLYIICNSRANNSLKIYNHLRPSQLKT